MCLAIPAEIVEIREDNQAIVNVGGVKKNISLALLRDEVLIGDFVIIHVGFALSKLDKEMAQQTLEDLKSII
ncbi:HypC/HybG/HupF family hydrogenase formation chaperone [Francisella philomiragia]|uniref:HypC/HybG/HupF family hydrogenase formation chaperone n=1 Tax=Francisella philomiragia TaxID=28110 RepID=UPI0005A56349|nr:HypC/HybG/HupF family hydrogenase formation chaperone [Francisella philomiragia]AJI55723.1 hydrogenase assembly chaperone HypC/HupF [Francisella philomiragia]MBK2095648.1 HypC/HybG/HupF family hydrogenase formation chaperone [Francisella philomiragia]MBK2252882.1 HypC/HybG/HupF family hydrogenase formation chaperone [Francisella philomiragia]QUE31348.1 HypC/HybG/HupF family hydrogenase formation chaperone [Francisella philomiragia]